MPGFPCHGVSSIGKIKNRKTVQQKLAVINGCVTAHVDDDLVRLELPFGMRKLASCDRAAVNHVVIRAGFLDNLSGECKGRSRGENHAVTAELQSGGCRDIVKSSSFGGQIV